MSGPIILLRKTKKTANKKKEVPTLIPSHGLLDLLHLRKTTTTYNNNTQRQ